MGNSTTKFPGFDVTQAHKDGAALHTSLHPTEPLLAFMAALRNTTVKDGPGVPLAALGNKRNLEVTLKDTRKANVLDQYYLNIGATPLAAAVRARRPDVVRALLKAGANTSIQGLMRDQRWDPVQMAAFTGEVSILYMLLEAGASLVPANGPPPLILTVRPGHIDAFTFLVSRGADVHLRDDLGRSPLHIAGSELFVRLIIECGADVNARANDGDTPLHAAIHPYTESAGSDVVIRALIDNKADINAVNEMGQTALHKRPWCQILLDEGADVNIIDMEGHTPLHLINSAADRLLSCGADINSTDHYGGTPLHTAAKNLKPDVVKELIAEGLRKDVRCNRSLTPYDWINDDSPSPYRSATAQLLALPGVNC